MAFEISGKIYAFTNSEDLSSWQYKWVKIDTSVVGGVIKVTAQGADAIGILQNAPTAGQGASVMIDGISKCVMGAAVTVGANVTNDTSGRSITSTATAVSGAAVTGSNTHGKALDTVANAGEVGTVLIRPVGSVPTTVG